MKKKCCKGKWHWKIGLGLLAIISAIVMFGCSRTFEDRVDRVVDCISSELDLSEEQETELNKIKEKVLALHKEHKSGKDDHFTKVRTLLLQESISETQIKKMITQKRQHVDELLPKLLPDLLRFHKSLTPEQKSEAVEYLDKFKKKISKWHK